MFIDKEERKEQERALAEEKQQPSDKEQIRRMLIFGGFTVSLLIFILLAFFLISLYINDDKEPAPEEEATTTEEIKLGQNGKLPDHGKEATSSDKYLTDVEAEKLNFGQFFQEPETPDISGAETYALPMNVKVDVANYHKVSRRLELDEYIDDLNSKGFAVLENQFEDEADNFYASYRLLNEKDLPVLLTSDFLLYYYHNILKRDFKTIEENIFYRNLWNINKSLYNTSKNKYENRRAEVGLVNDPLLEARRLETAFFATSLKLLQPSEEQIAEEKDKLAKENKFSAEEAAQYSIELPEYLKPDVSREVELIREGMAEEENSPVLLYERNYQEDFKIPEEYKNASRLRNFYLASNWLHSVFPLYYKGEICPDCLLDKEDWRINIIAAFLTADDFSSDQKLQNKWARIYKVISYFQGLRDDLTYLAYDEVLGKYKDGEEGRTLEELFASYEEADDNLAQMRKDLSEYSFSGLGGGFDKNSTTTMPKQGLKVLASPYWPNDFIFENLTLPHVRYYQAGQSLVSEGVDNITGCTESRISTQAYRCRGFGGDIVNLVYPASDLNDYFRENTNYELYDREMGSLRERLDKFDVNKWHSNGYWTMLDIMGKYLESDRISGMAFAKGDEWQNRRIDASLGAWTDLQTRRDEFKIYNLAAESEGLSGGADMFISENSYIEPELELVQQLRANTEMLHEMFRQLGITYETVSVDDDLTRMKKELSRIEEIIKKEISGEELSEEDLKFIDNFIKQYKVEEEGGKMINIGFDHARKGVTESIDGVELMVITYKKGDKKYFAIGPVYNYVEHVER